MRRSARGFTFIELLVAMTVLGALTAVAVPRYRLYKERAYLAALRSELGTLRVAEEAYWAENHAYSTDTTQLDWNGSSEMSLTITSSNLAAGFSATARHALAPALSCSTAVGSEATTASSGEIVCSPVNSGTGSGVGSAVSP
jgi:type IV pilus assembly protein PilA